MDYRKFKGAHFIAPAGTKITKKAKGYKSPFSLQEGDIKKTFKKRLTLGPDTPIIGNRKKKVLN